MSLSEPTKLRIRTEVFSESERNSLMILGIVGSGTMAAAIVTGLRSAGDSSSIFLSPRNATTASALAGQFQRVAVCESNQEVLDRCDTVLLAVRPQVAESVLGGLRFRPDHQILSIIAIFSVERLRGLVSPASRITRAVPLPSAANRESPTAIYPGDDAALKFFRLLGPAFAVDTEEQINAIGSVSSIVASYFAFAEGAVSWLSQFGIPEPAARDYVARMLPSLTREVAEAPTQSLRSMARQHATAGGLNEQLLTYLEVKGVFEALSHGLDEVMKRITAHPAK